MSASPDALVISKDLQRLGRIIDKRLTEITGRDDIAWFFHVFDPGAQGAETSVPGRASYIATADREEVKAAMKVLLKHWQDENFPDVPAHEVQ